MNIFRSYLHYSLLVPRMATTNYRELPKEMSRANTKTYVLWGVPCRKQLIIGVVICMKLKFSWHRNEIIKNEIRFFEFMELEKKTRHALYIQGQEKDFVCPWGTSKTFPYRNFFHWEFSLLGVSLEDFLIGIFTISQLGRQSMFSNVKTGCLCAEFAVRFAILICSQFITQ
jgi:hypothetical protein